MTIDRSAEIDVLEPGPELDALVAEKVIGINLTPSRDRAKMVVGYKRIGSTGPEGFSVTGIDHLVMVPAGDTLPTPANDVNDWNARYPIWIVDNVLNVNGELNDEIAAVRNDPMPYSTLISFAWDAVIEKIRERGIQVEVKSRFGRFAWEVYMYKGNHRVWQEKDLAAHAICLAALEMVRNG